MNQIDKLIHRLGYWLSRFPITYPKASKLAQIFLAIFGFVLAVMPFLGISNSTELHLQLDRLSDPTREFVGFFFNFKILIVYIVILLVWMNKTFYKEESRRLRYSLNYRNEIYDEWDAIRKEIPEDNETRFMIGKLGVSALDVLNRSKKDIISAINKNSRKSERVYWVSIREIGIIFSEPKLKPNDSFYDKAVKEKIEKELNNDKDEFFKDFQYEFVNIGDETDLERLERKAQTALDKKKQNNGKSPVQ